MIKSASDVSMTPPFTANPRYDPESAHELIPHHLRPKLAMDLAAAASLGYLSSLTLLNLHGNLLTGKIPEGLGKLENLQTLDLSK